MQCAHLSPARGRQVKNVEEKLNLLLAQSFESTNSRGYSRFEKGKTWYQKVAL